MGIGGPLRHRNFRLLWASHTTSQLGSSVTVVALPLTALLTLQANAFQVGALAACHYLAFLLIGLPSGVWVDRMRRRSVMLVADIGRGLLLGSVPLAYAFGMLTIWQLFVVALGTSMLTVFFDVASQSYLPSVLRSEQFIGGNSLLEASRTVPQVAGPGVGGLLVQWLTAPVALLVDAVSYVASAALLGGIRLHEDKPTASAERSLRTEMMEGLRFVVGQRMLRDITVSTALFNFFWLIGLAVLPVLLVRDLGLSPGLVGVVLSAGGLGGLLGALAAPKVTARLGQGPALVAATTVGALCAFSLPLARPGLGQWLVAAGYGLGMGCTVVYNVTQVSFRQRLCPPRLLGRMNATIRFVVFGAAAAGALAGGIGAERAGMRPTLWVAAFGALLAIVPLALSPLRSLRVLPTHAAEPGDRSELLVEEKR